MNKEELIVNQRRIICVKSGNPQFLILYLMDKHEINLLEGMIGKLASNSNQEFLFVSYVIEDWNRELSPWRAPAVFGKEDFKGEGDITLKFICNELMPFIIKHYNLDNHIKKIISGYSLAGLFSLWSTYQTDLFDGVGAVSPSVWFVNFLDYSNSNLIKTKYVYLSLGNKEEHTKNKTMAKVGDCIRELNDRYQNKEGVICTLQWNEGNHFVDVDKRMLKAFVWLMESINK